MEIDFLKLYEHDITPFIKERKAMKKNTTTGQWVVDDSKPPLKYLEWSRVLKLLYELGAKKVTYGNMRNSQTEHPVYLNSANTAPFVIVEVFIDDDRFELVYPVINGYEKGYADNQLHVHNATQRAFVKCVAINTGLGLSLWEKDEEQVLTEIPNNNSNELNIELNTKLNRYFSNAIAILGDANNVHAELNTNKNMFKNLYEGDNIIAKQEMIDKIIDLIIENKK